MKFNFFFKTLHTN